MICILCRDTRAFDEKTSVYEYEEIRTEGFVCVMLSFRIASMWLWRLEVHAVLILLCCLLSPFPHTCGTELQRVCP